MFAPNVPFHGTRNLMFRWSEMSTPSTHIWKMPLSTPESFNRRRTSTVYHRPFCIPNTFEELYPLAFMPNPIH